MCSALTFLMQTEHYNYNTFPSHMQHLTAHHDCLPKLVGKASFFKVDRKSLQQTTRNSVSTAPDIGGKSSSDNEF